MCETYFVQVPGTSITIPTSRQTATPKIQNLAEDKVTKTWHQPQTPHLTPNVKNKCRHTPTETWDSSLIIDLG